MRQGMRREVYGGRVVDLGIEHVTLPSGVEVDLEIIRHKGASAVVALDEVGRVVLIRQFRHAAGGFIWELPAGVLDPAGEAPEACAARELREETGLHASALTRLGTILTTPGFTDERIHLFLARDLTQRDTAREHDEVIAEVARFPLGDALAMVQRGDIVDAKTICGLHLAAAAAGVTP
jgi:ADP-ribose pyrophosphatase